MENLQRQIDNLRDNLCLPENDITNIEEHLRWIERRLDTIPVTIAGKLAHLKGENK